MRIGINAWFLSQPDTGTGQYTYHLAAYLPAADASNRYYLICDRVPAVAACLQHPSLTFHPTGNPWSGLRASLAKAAWEHRVLPRAVRDLALDVVHVPYVCWIPPDSCKRVVTVLDLALKRFSLRQLGTRSALDKALFSLSLRRIRYAERLLTISHSVKRELVEQLHFPAARIDPTLLAADPLLKEVADEQALARTTGKYRLPPDFVLYIGDRSHRKNLRRLLRAYASLPPGLARRFPLVLGGPAGMSEELKTLVSSLPNGDRVQFIGFVDRDDLAAVYSLASVFVFPSFYEGFGLPPLEAMSCGTPVITSAVSSLPEVVGQAAQLIDPFDENDIGRALIAVLEDGDLRNGMREGGFRQAARFSWERVARQTLAAYQKAQMVGGPGART